MTELEKRVIRKLWVYSAFRGTHSFEDWLKETFPNAKINEQEQLLDAVYNGKGYLWPKRRSNENQIGPDSRRSDVPS